LQQLGSECCWGYLLGGGYCLFEDSAGEENHLRVVGVQCPNQFPSGISRIVLCPHRATQKNIVRVHRPLLIGVREPSGFRVVWTAHSHSASQFLRHLPRHSNSIMLPPHCGQTKLMIEEIMLVFSSPGIRSIVLMFALLEPPQASSWRNSSSQLCEAQPRTAYDGNLQRMSVASKRSELVGYGVRLTPGNGCRLAQDGSSNCNAKCALSSGIGERTAFQRTTVSVCAGGNGSRQGQSNFLSLVGLD
jgi:hypothetical protein